MKSLNAPNAEAMLLRGLSAQPILQWVAVPAINHLLILKQDHVRAVPARPMTYPDIPDSFLPEMALLCYLCVNLQDFLCGIYFACFRVITWFSWAYPIIPVSVLKPKHGSQPRRIFSFISGLPFSRERQTFRVFTSPSLSPDHQSIINLVYWQLFLQALLLQIISIRNRYETYSQTGKEAIRKTF